MSLTCVSSSTDSAPSSPTKIRPTRQEAQEAVRTLIRWAGDSPDREGVLETPKRVTEAFESYFSGYDHDPAEILACTFKDVADYEEMVLLKHVPFYSHCEHHLAPIVGVAHVAYLPKNRVVGLSKLARLVDIFAKRLQIQEKMTAQIAQALQQHLDPQGVAVMIEATHHCLTARGAQKPGAIMRTNHFTGVFKTDLIYRQDFLNTI